MVREKKQYIIAIDAGTTSVRVVCYDSKLQIVDKQQQEFKQYYPQPGWVEHDAMEIWLITKRLLNKTIKSRQGKIASIGITNQRETTVVWNKKTGKPVHNAIVWQCRRTSAICDRLKKAGHEKIFKERTGLPLDAYFSGTKIKWILDNSKCDSQNILFGTIDSWLLWNMNNGELHATDFTNASRTLLYNVKIKQWDRDLARILQVPFSILPEVKNSQDSFGSYQGIPVNGVCGDQQAALFGQCAWQKGEAKNTYGTGCFLILNTGKKFIKSKHGLITTLTPDKNGKPLYALEGSAFIGGAVVQWLRDELKLIDNSKQSGEIASTVKDTNGVYMVPAFNGLGAPYWDQDARGIIVGLTRGANRQHIIRAAVESTAYQVYDLTQAMQKDGKMKIKELVVDGGATRDNFLMQFQADLLNLVLVLPRDKEATVRGAAMLAGLQIGFWPDATTLKRLHRVDKKFKPRMSSKQRHEKLSGWAKAVRQAQIK